MKIDKSRINEKLFLPFAKSCRKLQKRDNNYTHGEYKKKKMGIETSGTSTMHAEQEENFQCALGAQKTECTWHRKRNGCNKNMIVASIVLIFVAMHTVDASPSKDVQPSVRINKCCEKFEIYVDSRCTSAQEVNASKCSLKFRFHVKNKNVET